MLIDMPEHKVNNTNLKSNRRNFGAEGPDWRRRNPSIPISGDYRDDEILCPGDPPLPSSKDLRAAQARITSSSSLFAELTSERRRDDG
jgi:hypothetical protein